MKKTELEELLKRQAEQIAALNQAHEREIKCLVDAIEKLRAEREGACRPTRRRTQSPALWGRPPMTLMESKRERVLELLRIKTKVEDIPSVEDFVRENAVANLAGVDDAAFTGLIRKHFNHELAEAYASRRMNMRVFRALVCYFSDLAQQPAPPELGGAMVKAAPPELADELNDAVARLRAADAAREVEEEAIKRRQPNPGPFRLRGRTQLEKFFNEAVVDIVHNSALYAKLGIHFPKGFILEGAPGCGKTFAVERLAEHLRWNVVRIDSDSIGSPFIHGTAKKIQEKFREAAAKAPSIVIIDEMEAFTRNRATLPGNDTHSAEEVDSFLQCLQTATEKRILVAGMTNHIESIDPAILRAGRLGAQIRVGMPSLQEVLDVLDYALERRPHAEFDLRPHAERLLDHPLSDVAHAVDEAAMCAARSRRERVEEADLTRAIDDLLQDMDARNSRRKPIGFAG